MRIFTLCHFSTVKHQVARLQTSYSNIPQNILQLLDRKLIAIPNHPLSIIKEKIKSSLTDKYTVLWSIVRATRV
jgi:hypothetical protein